MARSVAVMTSETITIAMDDGPCEAYVTRPDDQPHPGVLMFPDAIGLRPQIREMADRIAAWGYVVLVPHMFYRSGTSDELSPDGDLLAPGPARRSSTWSCPSCRPTPSSVPAPTCRTTSRR